MVYCFDWISLTEEQEIHIHGNKGADVGIIAQANRKSITSSCYYKR